VTAEATDVDGVDQLYELEPAQFVAARDGLARRLRAGGDREAAEAVKKLRRPTVVAWALNQVARSHPDEIAQLIAAGAAVGRAQAQAVGGGAPAELREATRRRRQIASQLARAATELAGAAHHDEAVATIDAASFDPEVAELLRRGRLTKELPPPSGFGLAAMPDALGEPGKPKEADASSAGGPPPPPPPVDLEPLRRDVARWEGVVAEAQGAVADAEADVRRAEEALDHARAGVEAARATLERAVQDRDRATAALAEAESVEGSG
jgi:hypothetical protein